MPLGEKLNEAYTWQAVYETIPLNPDNLKPLYPKMIYAGDLTGEIVSDLWEIDANGIQINTYSNIDRAKLVCFNVYKTVEAIPYLRDYCTGSPPSNPPTPLIRGAQSGVKRPLLAKPFITVEIRPNCRLIWRRRRRQRAFGGESGGTIAFRGTTGTVFLTLYMVGWQESFTLEGSDHRNFQAINFIYHYTSHGLDTSKDIVVMSRGWKDEVEWFDFEMPT